MSKLEQKIHVPFIGSMMSFAIFSTTLWVSVCYLLLTLLGWGVKAAPSHKVGLLTVVRRVFSFDELFERVRPVFYIPYLTLVKLWPYMAGLALISLLMLGVNLRYSKKKALEMVKASQSTTKEKRGKK